MGKKRRRMSSQKFTRKFAAKFAKFKAAVAEAISITAGTYEEIVEEREAAEEALKVVANEVDESATAEPKPKKRSRKISPRKKTPDSKKKPAKKRTTKRKPAKKK
jgi:acetate kinase